MAQLDHLKSLGGCLCGAIRYEAVGDPLWVAHCHCVHCRRNTGSAVATFIGYLSEQVTFIKGARAIFASSPGVKRGFCQTCGTPLSYEGDRCTGETHVYLSTIDDPNFFPAQFHVFYGEKINWFDTADGLPRHNTTSAEGEAD